MNLTTEEERYKIILRTKTTEVLEDLRDRCLDTVRLCNEVLREKEIEK